MLKLSTLLLLVTLSSSAFAQQSRQPAPKPLPSDMDCEKMTGDKVTVPTSSNTLVKRGAEYFLCRPKSEMTLKKARTAAVVVRSTQTITCGDGSTNDCLRQDTKTQAQVEGFLDETDLWRYFAKASPSKADIIVEFIANNRADPASLIVLEVEDSDSGVSLFHETRAVADIENDVNRLIAHFVAQTEREPIFSKADMEKARACAAATEQLKALQAQYEVRRDDFTYKNSHQLDAQMEECNLHWKEFVCLATGGGIYATQWNESGLEMQRKLALEFEGLHEMEQRMAAIRQNLCGK
jgi:hypothetical protein